MDARARIRATFTTQHGHVVEFSIQLEVQDAEEWRPVVRYDTAHGFAHLDVYARDGSREKVPVYMGDFGDALTYAQADLNQHWREYRDRFLQE